MRKAVWMATALAVSAVLVMTARAQHAPDADHGRDDDSPLAGAQRHQRDDESNDLKPDGKGFGKAPKAPRTKTPGNGINYHGGPVLLGTPNIHYIWYGNWAGNSAVSILSDLASNIGGSSYFNINTTYYDASNTHVTNAIGFNSAAAPYVDSYSRGKALTDNSIKSIVADAIAGGSLGPADTNGVYFVLTSADVNETSGFCTQYCGWHTNGTIGGKDIKYTFVGNPDRCPSACSAQTIGPNGNGGADAMASIIAHELEESVTDPDLNAWFDSRGAENADKCAWTFGSLYRTANKAYANVKIGSRDYLIQQNWVNASGGYCAKSY